MASTPSASALSAVLRCQRNILARKPANKKRAPASVYGMKYGESVKSYIRSLWGFIFHRERVGIPGVLFVTTQFETSGLGKSSKLKSGNSKKLKNSSKTENKTLSVKVPAAIQLPKMSDYNSAFKSQNYSNLSRNNLILRLGERNTTWTCCICVVCAKNKSSLYHSNVNSFFPNGLLGFLKDKLIYFTTAVSDSLRTQLGIDWNQLHPDCDKLSGCVKCTCEHHGDQPKTPEGTELEK